MSHLNTFEYDVKRKFTGRGHTYNIHTYSWASRLLDHLCPEGRVGEKHRGVGCIWYFHSTGHWARPADRPGQFVRGSPEAGNILLRKPIFKVNKVLSLTRTK